MWWSKKALQSRIERLEAASSPETQHTIIIRLVDDLQSLQELPEEPQTWLTWSQAEKRSWQGQGLKVVTLSCQDEVRARSAVR